jgi:hypothetical protein
VEAINSQFKVPLPVSEVKAIAKSIANWTYREFTPEKFRQSQAKKGAKGGKASKGGGRPISESSENQQEPWSKLGISRRTYYNWKQSGKI